MIKAFQPRSVPSFAALDMPTVTPKVAVRSAKRKCRQRQTVKHQTSVFADIGSATGWMESRS